LKSDKWKNVIKTQEEESEVFEFKDKLQERKRLEEYIAFRESAEEEYLNELAMEELAARKEIKFKGARLEKEQLKDEIMEAIKDHCFKETQNERKKNEKKKNLWDQYKAKMAEKQAKRQKETEESIIEKKELIAKRIDGFAWKKKQATQERDMWRDNYLLLEKLIGDAK